MARIDLRVDAFIERKAAFARPILRHIRAAVHRACPEVEEAIKWGMPSFTYKGQILAGMAGVQRTCDIRLLAIEGSDRHGRGGIGDGPVRAAQKRR